MITRPPSSWVREQILPTSDAWATADFSGEDFRPLADPSALHGDWLAQGGGHFLELTRTLRRVTPMGSTTADRRLTRTLTYRSLSTSAAARRMSVSLFTAFAVAGSINGSSSGWAPFAEAGARLLASPVLVDATFLGFGVFVGAVARAALDGVGVVSGSCDISLATAASASASTDSSGAAGGTVTEPGAGDARRRRRRRRERARCR